MGNRNRRVEWEVPVHEMSRRIKAKEIKRKKKKTKRNLKVGKILSCGYPNLLTLFVYVHLLETIKVFDGNCSLRRRIFRAITVPRTCNLEQLLTTALRAFHIAREPNVNILLCYYVSSIT